MEIRMSGWGICRMDLGNCSFSISIWYSSFMRRRAVGSMEDAGFVLAEQLSKRAAPYFRPRASAIWLRQALWVQMKAAREALIKSLSDFILGFLSNARNQSTRIASYLRRLMTQHWIKIHMKFDSAN